MDAATLKESAPQPATLTAAREWLRLPENREKLDMLRWRGKPGKRERAAMLKNEGTDRGMYAPRFNDCMKILDIYIEHTQILDFHTQAAASYCAKAIGKSTSTARLAIMDLTIAGILEVKDAKVQVIRRWYQKSKYIVMSAAKDGKPARPAKAKLRRVSSRFFRAAGVWAAMLAHRKSKQEWIDAESRFDNERALAELRDEARGEKSRIFMNDLKATMDADRKKRNGENRE